MKKERLLRQRGVFLPAVDDIPFAQRASRGLLRANGPPFAFLLEKSLPFRSGFDANMGNIKRQLPSQVHGQVSLWPAAF
jgi:hypothetical protein